MSGNFLSEHSEFRRVIDSDDIVYMQRSTSIVQCWVNACNPGVTFGESNVTLLDLKPWVL